MWGVDDVELDPLLVIAGNKQLEWNGGVGNSADILTIESVSYSWTFD